MVVMHGSVMVGLVLSVWMWSVLSRVVWSFHGCSGLVIVGLVLSRLVWSCYGWTAWSGHGCLVLLY